MADCIERECAIAIVDGAAELHPYSKDRSNPGTYSEFNNGWESACDYILSHIETAKSADVERHGCWGKYWPYSDGYRCSCCKNISRNCWRYCPNCGAKMDLEG